MLERRPDRRTTPSATVAMPERPKRARDQVSSEAHAAAVPAATVVMASSALVDFFTFAPIFQCVTFKSVPKSCPKSALGPLAEGRRPRAP